MARPQGHYLNRDAWEDWTGQHVGQNLTTIAKTNDINRATLSGLVSGNQRASVELAHQVAAAVGCKVGTLFPTLSRDANRITTEAA